ncbi:riboflavin synthase subunit beta [Aurantibacter sp.]|uniref:riboflavin synthase subunit beta n=1 Tax=Aurantibacter sp. TaxID=2807103 RepID=UPI00326475DF
MSFLRKFTKLGKNKTFDYSPRYYDDKGEGSPFKLEHRFDKYRTTAHVTRGLKGKFGNAIEDMRKEGDRNLRLRMIVIIAILIFAFLYVIDFDISIFFPQ